MENLSDLQNCDKWRLQTMFDKFVSGNQIVAHYIHDLPRATLSLAPITYENNKAYR